MKDYIEQAIRTESGSFFFCDQSEQSRLIHAGMGMCTEAGEFLDVLKKELFYNKEPDLTNLKEELGDMLWYMAIAMHALSTDFDTEMERNINKLRTRYPDKFTSENAITRNLDAERTTLEGI